MTRTIKNRSPRLALSRPVGDRTVEQENIVRSGAAPDWRRMMNSHVDEQVQEIYLDANATTCVLPQAAKAASDTMETLFGNPSSSHVTGLRARYILESTRDLAERVIGAESGNVIFTSGATEAIQTAVFSALRSIQKKKAAGELGEDVLLLYGATEHKAVPEAVRHWNNMLGIGAEVLPIPVDAEGQVDLEFLAAKAPRAGLICTMAVNNETGVVQDLGVIEDVIRNVNPNVLWLVDSVQALAKVEMSLHTRSIDYATFSGHKLYAPKGIGLLYVRDGSPFTQMIVGGGQERGLRSGTENLPGVAAFGAVLQSLVDPDDRTFQSEETLHEFRDMLIAALQEAFPETVFNTPFARAVPTTINFSVKGFPSKEILDLFDAAQIRVSAGSACGSGAARSYVLDAMGVPEWRSESAIRLSFGPASTRAEIEIGCRRIREAGGALRHSCLLIPTDIEVESPRQNGLIQLKRGSTCTWIYACSDSKTCFVIDPIAGLAERIEFFVECQRYTVLGILDTHSHADHVSCRPMLLQLLNRYAAPEAQYCDALGWPIRGGETVTLGDGSRGDAIRLHGTLHLVRTPLPGHTDDSQLFLVGTVDDQGKMEPANVSFAFTGDTLLIGGIGRTDFDNSTVSGMYHSLIRLQKLVGSDTIICPAHDYTNDFATTTGAELRNNPLLERVCNEIAPMTEGQFVEEKVNLDKDLQDQSVHEIICGVVNRADANISAIDVRPDDRDEFFSRHRDALFVDVREPHEYQLFRNWSAVGTEIPPQNIPLSKFANFLRKFLSEESAANREIIFICRSGTRSALAAESLRRMGIDTAWSISGGIALGSSRKREAVEARQI